MNKKRDIVSDGLFGLLIGDALGVPYEFNSPNQIPPLEQIEYIPPKGFRHSYPDVPPGTWSDDGAQALCLLDSLITCGGLDLKDFASRLLQWVDKGLWAVDGVVFDCGIQTMEALRAYGNGVSPDKSGFVIPNGKGNGSLMRVLPLPLFSTSSKEKLVEDAHRQSLVTHGHICNQVCCGLYCLWARGLMDGQNVEDAYEEAVLFLEEYYKEKEEYLHELHCCIAEGTPTGTGYVVDSIRSAKYLLMKYHTYEDVVKAAIALGNDTDTTAAIAGGLAGIAYGNIPIRWMNGLRSKERVVKLISSLS